MAAQDSIYVVDKALGIWGIFNAGIDGLILLFTMGKSFFAFVKKCYQSMWFPKIEVHL